MVNNSTTNRIENANPEIGGQSLEARESIEVIPVIAFGASAGGLDVFKRLLGVLPCDTGFAIVIVQHLDPNHNSLLAEILARATSMPVHEAVDRVRLKPDEIYVMPPSVDMTMEGGALRLAPRGQAPGPHTPIDRFLRSMADQCGSRSIGVILSGTGSDGSAGVEAIKATGGVTFAQDAETAKFSSMPEAAVATGCVNFVLPPEGIAAEIVRIGRHPYITDAIRGGPEPTSSPDHDHFGHILATLKRATGIDFSGYRQQMVKRRILRRLALGRIGSIAEYADRLRNDPDEVDSLHRDLLISVTSFFRDKNSFEFLRTAVFPRLLQGRSLKDPIRVWVAGCATGEEAFSVAISLREYLKESGADFPVQLFASDINQRAIDKARTGKYPEHIASDLSHERLNRYFTKIDGGYQVNKDLRQMCIFARHNLIEDPPFSNLDLITCRNVLIYLGSVQKDIIHFFHYALKPAGFLMLGSAEGAAENGLFSAVDGDQGIYIKRAIARKLRAFPSPLRIARSAANSSWATAAPSEGRHGIDLRKEIDGILLSKYSPAGVVVDENLEVLEIRGHPSPCLTLPPGKVSFHLMKLIPDTGLFLDAEKLIQQVRESGEPARQEAVAYEQAGANGVLNLEAVPLDSSENRSTLLILEPGPGSQGEADPTKTLLDSDVRDRQISRLKQQLADAKERFTSALEVQQASREESQNTMEEALSTNEELQSLNEELETAKEELQSTNEELATVNGELQAKNTALENSRHFAVSIVETVRQPLMVLDTNLRIKMANRAFCRAFQLSPLNTEGQIVYSLAGGSWDVPGLRDGLDSLLRGGTSFPDFEVEGDFGFGRRNLVFGGCRIDGLHMILLAVDDVTELKIAQQAKLRNEEHLRQSQKLEAVGRLAGGIAHDFNNLLTAIIGYSCLLQVDLKDIKGALARITEIKTAGEKAAALTQQLLAFSRRQVLQPKVVSLNAIVADFEGMLRRLVGERIVVEVECDAGILPARVDPGEFGRVIMNLSLNARDAMPAGGTLTIRTANATLTEVEAAAMNMAPGPYVMVAVHDTGVGIDCEAKAHIFEPFFTTKETGKGTGLGLASVLGIVEQSGGAIVCRSEVGQGTSFQIYVPAVTEAASKGTLPAAGIDRAPRGSEVILLVEDDDMVRKLARMVLETCGYVVYAASNGRAALALCESHQGPIDLLLSDVVMPELGGREMAEAALLMRPNLKVLFMSGHTQDVVLKEGVQKGMPFLQKPFTVTALSQKVRDILDSRALCAGQG